MHHEKTIKWPEHVHKKKRDSVDYLLAYQEEFWRAFFSYRNLLPLIILTILIASPLVPAVFAIVDCLKRRQYFTMVFMSAIGVSLIIAIVVIYVSTIIPEFADCRCAADEAGVKARDEARATARSRTSGSSGPSGSVEEYVIEGIPIEGYSFDPSFSSEPLGKSYFTEY